MTTTDSPDTAASALPSLESAGLAAPAEDVPEEVGEEGGDDEQESAPDGDEDLEENVPQDGDTFDPGHYLLELTTAIPCKTDTLILGLNRIGFHHVRMDRSQDTAYPLREHRLVAELKRPIVIHQRDVMQWAFAQRLTVAAGRAMKDFRLKLEAYELEPNGIYEGLFFSRERSQPTRKVVEERLGRMGFAPIKLLALERNARLDARPDSSITIWLGILEWEMPPSCITEDEPFYFEDLVAV